MNRRDQADAHNVAARASDDTKQNRFPCTRERRNAGRAGAFALAVKLVNGMMMAHDGPIKTFPLRGIKDSPPYLHDGRSPTLEDAVEYFNLIQRLHLTAQEKKDLVAFLLCL